MLNRAVLTHLMLSEISNVVVQMEREKPGIFGTRGAMAQVSPATSHSLPPSRNNP